MNPVSKLLRHNLSLTQTVGFVLANLVGLTIVVAGLMIYLDAKPIWNGDDSFMKTDYVVVNKRVSMQNTLGASTAFTPAEVADLKARPWVRSLAPFTTADFRVSASITAPGQDRGLNTFLFFESLPREYVDVEGSWTYKPGDATVPVIMSRDYLALYNFGFATSAGLPQVSEKMISSVPLQLNITSNGTPGIGTRVQARIVGFSSRLNTILVPQEFMDWANATYGTGAPREPSRIIIDTNSPGDVAITDYIDEHGWEIGGDKSAARASFRPAARRQASREKQKQAVCGGDGRLPRSSTSPQAAPIRSASSILSASRHTAAASTAASGTPNGSSTRTSPASRHTAAA